MLTGIKKCDEGSVSELWALTYPLVFSTASATIMQFVNRVFLAHYSSDALAACVPAGILSFTLIAFFQGFASYTNVFIAQYYGGKRYASLSVSLWQGVVISLFSAICIILLIPVGQKFISISNHSDAIKLLENQYFTIITIFGGLVPLNAALSSFFTGRGKTKVTMAVNILGNIINIALSYTLIFGIGPFPEMGIKGAACALVTGNIVMVLTYFSLIFSERNRKEYRTSRVITVHWPTLKRMVRYGAPSGVEFVLDIASFTVFVFLAGNLDKLALTSNNIILSVNMLAFMPILGIGMATQTLVGQYLGRGSVNSAVKIAHSGIKLAMMYTVPTVFLFLIFPDFFVGLLTSGSDPDFVAIHAKSVTLMKVLAMFILFDSANIIFVNVIKGAGDTKFAMIVIVLLAWFMFIPGVYAITTTLKIDIIYAWWWITLYVACLAAIFYMRFKSGKWKTMKITH